MTILVCYPSKKALKAEIGKTLTHKETSMFGKEYQPTGKFTVAYRPAVWRYDGKDGPGREFFATVTMRQHRIVEVE